MRKITGIAIVNADAGKKIAYTYSEIDDKGNITNSNVRGSFFVIDDSVTAAITTIENSINTRIAE